MCVVVLEDLLNISFAAPRSRLCTRPLPGDEQAAYSSDVRSHTWLESASFLGCVLLVSRGRACSFGHPPAAAILPHYVSLGELCFCPVWRHMVYVCTAYLFVPGRHVHCRCCRTLLVCEVGGVRCMLVCVYVSVPICQCTARAAHIKCGGCPVTFLAWALLLTSPWAGLLGVWCRVRVVAAILLGGGSTIICQVCQTHVWGHTTAICHSPSRCLLDSMHVAACSLSCMRRAGAGLGHVQSMLRFGRECSSSSPISSVVLC